MRAVCAGNSHMGALIDAAIADKQGGKAHSCSLAFVLLHRDAFQPSVMGNGDATHLNPILTKALTDAGRATQGTDHFSIIEFEGPSQGVERCALFSFVGGNAHNIIGLTASEETFDVVLCENPTLPVISGARIIAEAEIYALLRESLANEIAPVFSAITSDINIPIYHVESPPPIRDNNHISENLDPYFLGNGLPTISPPFLRYKLWRLHSRVVRDLCNEYGITFVEHPSEAVDLDGFLLPEFVPNNATHANHKYGALILTQIENIFDQNLSINNTVHTNPYTHIGPQAFWKEAVAKVPIEKMAPLSNLPFRINSKDRVATAGSCFAQHIAHYLQASGFNYFIAETAHSLIPPDIARKFNYGVFSARYGNIYSSRQLLQLFQRAEGIFTPRDHYWKSLSGSGYVDPYRPTIQPTPFTTIRELEEDRSRHLSAVREMMRTLDVFIFTLGLTECWVNMADGAAYPLCPGTAGGIFDPMEHAFLNLRVDEVRADLISAFEILRRVNPLSRIVITVSPVPLKATASRDHVLSATTYSKSVLRSAAGEVIQACNDVAYFPSYEIITGSYSRGRYFLENLRDVNSDGIDHVMRVFHAHMMNSAATIDSESLPPTAPQSPAKKSAAELICDEEMLEMERLISLRS